MNRRDTGPLAILALVPAVLFLDILRGANAFFVRDVMHYYFPAKKMLREIVLGGHFPYWNPWFSAGQPLAANPEHEVFYPLTWLILLPDYVYALQLLPLLHIFIATFAMYALLRSMEVGRFAACVGALSFGIGGVVCSTLNLFPCLFGLAWLPLTCLYARRFLLHRHRRDFALAAFFFGLQLLVGEPVTILQTGLLLGLYALFRKEKIPQRVAMVGLISIVALLLAAVQMLPAFDHLGDTGRGRGFDFEGVRTWSTPPIRFAEALYPHILGRFDYEGSPAYWGSELYGDKRTGFYFSIYGGLAIAVLAIAGVMARVRGWALFLAIAAVSGVMAAGDFTPLLRLLYDSGVATTMRYPEKFLLMGAFAAIVFGARVLDSLLRGDEHTRRATIGVALGVTLLAFLAAAGTMTTAYASLFRLLFRVDASEPSLAFARQGWLLAGARGLVLLLLIAVIAKVRRPVWLALFGAFVVIDVGMQVPDITPRIPSSFYRDTPPSLQSFPPQRDAFRIFHFAEWTPRSSRAKTYRRPSAEYYWIQRNSLSPHLPAAYGLRTVIDGDFDETNLRPERDFTASVWELAANGPRDWIDIVMSMSNAWYLGVYRRPEEAMAQAGGWTRELAPVRFLEGSHPPRYYFASEVVHVRDRVEFVRQLRAQRYSRQVAFIHEAAFPAATGNIRSLREWTNGARLEVDAAGRAFLVMSVTPHKYWRVTIDGRETPSLVTNIGYQGVVVPMGRHIVEMRYRNPLIPIGGAVSALTLLALLLACYSPAARHAPAREESDRRPSRLQRRADAPGDV